MHVTQQTTHGRSRSIPVSLVAFVICAAWPVILATLWLTTGRTLPTINVRWVPHITGEQRSDTERALSLVWYEAKEPRTVRYFLLDSSKQNLERLVVNSLVEDTAFVNRGLFVLENAPTARMWLGDQFATAWPFAFLYVTLFGCLISGVMLVLRD